jgi:hypothetical protein
LRTPSWTVFFAFQENASQTVFLHNDLENNGVSSVLRFGTPSVRPRPIAHLGQVVTNGADVLAVFGQFVAQELLEVRTDGLQA